jgi:DNA-binding response OmpR family regulator
MSSFSVASPSAARRPLIFVVEDEEDIARLICYHLEASGYATRWFPDCMKVLEAAPETPPVLFLLDVLIPGGDGFDLCRRIRGSQSLSSCHIIFLTARTGEMDRIKGLELGGDDYLTKPFSPRELIARVRAVLRSSRQRGQPEVLRAGTLEIDSSSMTVKSEGRLVPTTVREFRLLEYLAQRPGRVFTRDQLLDAVWMERFVTPRSVDVYMRRLREKIEIDPDNPRYLRTVRGIGYRFDAPS